MEAPQTQLADRLQEVGRRLQSGEIGDALAGAEELTRLAPEFPQGWFIASYIRLRMGDRHGALADIEQANRLAGEPSPGWQLHELLCLDACGVRDRGIALGRRLLEADVPDPAYFANLAQALYDLRQFDLARRAQVRAVELNPNGAGLHFGLASIQLALGNPEAARGACERCLELDPGNAEAQLLRSGLDRQTETDNHVQELRRRLDSPPGAPRDHARLLYALAKELDDLGEYQESFTVLEQGAWLYRGTLQFDLKDELRFLTAIPWVWTREQVAAPAPQIPGDPPRPIFVAGLPVTGTAVVEQILGAHTQVVSAGELPDFGRRLSEMMEALPEAQGRSRADMVACTPRLDLPEAGRRYLGQAAPLAGDSPWFVDSFPQNALYLGLIPKALPGAKLILVWREPMDTCYWMYRQLFTDIYQFSYDLDELGRYFLAYRDLMRHWVQVLGERLHVVHYEDLLERPEEEIRRLLDFCGLAWEPACAGFHSGPSATAGAGPVRQATEPPGAGRWRCYRDDLRPLEERFEAEGCLDDWRL